MKRIIAILFVISLFGCNTEKVKELEGRVAELDSLNSTQSRYVEDVSLTISDIQNNLENIREKQGVLSKVSRDVEAGKASKDPKSLAENIKNDIVEIDSYLAENRKKIAELERRAQSYRGEIKGLKKLVSELKATIEQREQEIVQLKTEIASLNLKIEGLETQVAQQTQVIQTQTQEINTAYYIVATEDSLKQKGIAERKGGVIGIGRKLVLKTDFNMNNFSSVDITKATEIKIPQKPDEIEIMTPHDATSYKIEAAGDKGSVLKISNPKGFWTKSKCLVVRIED
ncbi:MAG: hypothetical protein HGB19_00835 [Chlorobiales bacterium]|jgi:uncharacterized coiled-coil protein SlyX|nr:hypothetical protein [Chlorobiales bacterium]